MAASPKQKQAKVAHDIGKSPVVKTGDAGRESAPRQHVAYAISNDGTPADRYHDRQMRHRVGEWNASEHSQEDLQLADYIESRALKWIMELELIADLALHPRGDLPPDYELAAKIFLGLVKLSNASRQRLDLTAQIAMSSGPDLSQLSDNELRAIELCDDEQLNDLTRRIGKLKS